MSESTGDIKLRCLYRLVDMSESDEGMLDVIKFCVDLGMIADRYECPKCGKCMVLTKTKRVGDRYEWVCRSKKGAGHHITRSIRRGTWFEQSKLSLANILLMTAFFVREVSQNVIMNELDLSPCTVCDWRGLFREICLEACLSSPPIGGPGVIVEIDECNFRKHKLNRGERLGGKWFLIGVERGGRKCFLRVVKNLDNESLVSVIKSSVILGSNVYIGFWKSHESLEIEGYRHMVTDHSTNFKGTARGMHTNAIKGTWSAIKKQIAFRTEPDQFDSYLAEHLWRKNQADQNDHTRAFFRDIARVCRPPTSDRMVRFDDPAQTFESTESDEPSTSG
ncbi:hypothetical protein AAG570_009083 [Ranatra chinensis]|uniref:ISXO2-like transposase domain-containing protein n=1 Tax=Ranatra chinensis TaxID=642074 RepID=A0ABD0YST8_9HEMI